MDVLSIFSWHEGRCTNHLHDTSSVGNRLDYRTCRARGPDNDRDLGGGHSHGHDHGHAGRGRSHPVVLSARDCCPSSLDRGRTCHHQSQHSAHHQVQMGR